MNIVDCRAVADEVDLVGGSVLTSACEVVAGPFVVVG